MKRQGNSGDGRIIENDTVLLIAAAVVVVAAALVFPADPPADPPGGGCRALLTPPLGEAIPPFRPEGVEK